MRDEENAGETLLTTPSHERFWPRQLMLQVALAAVYFAAGKFGLSLAFLHPSASAVWPPTAIALVAILCLGYRVWPAIWVGALLVNLTTKGTWATSLGIATGNTLEAVIAAMLVSSFARGREAFDNANDVIRFAIVAAIISTAISATIGVISLALGGFATLHEFWPIWLTWWLGDASSNLILAPLLLVWIGRPLPKLDRRRLLEAGALFATVVVVGLTVVGGWFPTRANDYPLAYLALLPLLWAAFRFGRRGAATAAFVMSVIAIRGVMSGGGPFARFGPNESLVLLQAFMATLSLTALVLAAGVLEIKRTHEALRAAGNAKDQFLAVLSHELRTPLTPVLATLSGLNRDRTLPESVRDELEMLQRNVQLEARLIDDLLDLNRIARGKFQLNLGPVNLHEAIERALQISHPRNSADGRFTIAWRLDAREFWINGDPARVEQVFWNLMSNALKFMPAGGTLTVRTKNLPHGRIRASVIDTGVGIAPEDLVRLFRPFEQGQASPVRAPGGLGLGLAICRSIVTALGGTIKAQSGGVGFGARFDVTLSTIATPVAPAERFVEQTSVRSSNGILRILLVEDHADSARAVSRLLTLGGHAVRIAGTVAEATQLASDERFDLLISDVGLPDGTGLELMRDLKERYNLRGIALSGYGMEEDIRRSRDAGFAEHLTKPIEASRLEAAISGVVGAER